MYPTKGVFSMAYTLEYPSMTKLGCFGHTRVGTRVPPGYTLRQVCLVGHIFWGTRVPNLVVMVIPG